MYISRSDYKTLKQIKKKLSTKIVYVLDDNCSVPIYRHATLLSVLCKDDEKTATEIWLLMDKLDKRYEREEEVKRIHKLIKYRE